MLRRPVCCGQQFCILSATPSVPLCHRINDLLFFSSYSFNFTTTTSCYLRDRFKLVTTQRALGFLSSSRHPAVCLPVWGASERTGRLLSRPPSLDHDESSRCGHMFGDVFLCPALKILITSHVKQIQVIILPGVL